MAAEVHLRQASGLPYGAPGDAQRFVLSGCSCLLTFAPWSLHYVNDALLFQVTALGCRGRSGRAETQEDRKDYTLADLKLSSVIEYAIIVQRLLKFNSD